MKKPTNIIFRPVNKKQELFISDTKTKEILFGGAAGPGKTLCLVIAPLQFVHHPDFRGIIFRREEADTNEIVDRGLKYYYPFRARFYKHGKMFKFPSGATIRIAGMKRELDYLSYKGFEYNFIGFDELVQFHEVQYIEMFHPSRSSSPDLTAIIRATTNPNPGAVGHDWVKRRFVDAAIPGKKIIDKASKLERLYIPSTIFDNPVLLKNNPDYINNLRLLPEYRQKQLIEGDWETAPDGAFVLDEFYHKNDTFSLEEAAKNLDWTFFMTFDWGFRDPFAALWFAYHKKTDHLVLYRELYGCEKGRENAGIRLISTKVADLINESEFVERKLGVKIKHRLADPSIFHTLPKFRGKEILETSNTISKDFELKGVNFKPADNNREQGFAQVQKRLAITKVYDEDGKLKEVQRGFSYLSGEAADFVRTMKKIVFSKHGEDVNTRTEDHLYDAFRYGCMFSMPKEIKKIQTTGRKQKGTIL